MEKVDHQILTKADHLISALKPNQCRSVIFYAKYYYIFSLTASRRVVPQWPSGN